MNYVHCLLSLSFQLDKHGMLLECQKNLASLLAFIVHCYVIMDHGQRLNSLQYSSLSKPN